MAPSKIPLNIRIEETGEVKTVLGRMITVVDWMETFIYKDEKQNHYFIAELNSGALVWGGKTITEATTNALRMVEIIGKEPILRVISELVDKYGNAN